MLYNSAIFHCELHLFHMTQKMCQYVPMTQGQSQPHLRVCIAQFSSAQQVTIVTSISPYAFLHDYVCSIVKNGNRPLSCQRGPSGTCRATLLTSNTILFRCATVIFYEGGVWMRDYGWKQKNCLLLAPFSEIMLYLIYLRGFVDCDEVLIYNHEVKFRQVSLCFLLRLFPCYLQLYFQYLLL